MELVYYPAQGCNSYTGYGRLEVGLAGGLRNAGVDLKLKATRADDVALVVGYPDWLTSPHVRGLRRWLLTMSESTKVSQTWVDIINAETVGVMVTCAGLVDVYRDSGVSVPVVNVGMAVELDPAAVAIALKITRSSSKYRYLTYSYGDLRKGAELAAMAFKRMHAGDERFELVIKARENAESVWLAALGSDPQITVVGGQQDEADWLALLASADCFVFPSRGEGYGLPPREATLMGVPTIATNWLGLADVERWGIPLRVRELRPSVFDFHEANAVDSLWAQPDENDLMRCMRWRLEWPKEARLIARRGAAYLRETQTWDLMGERVAGVLAGEVVR